jgi:hypothetical protein
MLADFDAIGSLVNQMVVLGGSPLGLERRWVMLVEQTPVGQGYRSRSIGVLENPAIQCWPTSTRLAPWLTL